jgi:hypothetical protein
MADTVDIFFRTNADEAARETKNAAKATRQAEDATEDLAKAEAKLIKEQQRAARIADLRERQARRRARALRDEQKAAQAATVAARQRNVGVAKEAFAQAGAGGGAFGRLSPIASAIGGGASVGGKAGLALGALGVASVGAGLALTAFSAASQRAMKAAADLTRAQQEQQQAIEDVNKQLRQRAGAVARVADPSLRRIQAGVGTEGGLALIKEFKGSLAGVTGDVPKALELIAAIAGNPALTSMADKRQALRAVQETGQLGGDMGRFAGQVTSKMIRFQESQAGRRGGFAPSLAEQALMQETGGTIEQVRRRGRNLATGDLMGAGERLGVSARTSEEIFASAMTGKATEDFRQAMTDAINPLAKITLERFKQEEKQLRILEEQRDAQGKVDWAMSKLGRLFGGPGSPQDQIDDMARTRSASLFGGQ